MPYSCNALLQVCSRTGGDWTGQRAISTRAVSIGDRRGARCGAEASKRTRRRRRGVYGGRVGQLTGDELTCYKGPKQLAAIYPTVSASALLSSSLQTTYPLALPLLLWKRVLFLRFHDISPIETHFSHYPSDLWAKACLGAFDRRYITHYVFFSR